MGRCAPRNKNPVQRVSIYYAEASDGASRTTSLEVLVRTGNVQDKIRNVLVLVQRASAGIVVFWSRVRKFRGRVQELRRVVPNLSGSLVVGASA